MEQGIDAARVFAAGLSRGAGFTAMLAILSSQYEIASGTWVSPFAANGINSGYHPAPSCSPAAASPKRPVWAVHGTGDSVVLSSYGEDLVDALVGGGWDVTFTPVDTDDHTWLWRAGYGQTNSDLLDFFLDHPAERAPVGARRAALASCHERHAHSGVFDGAGWNPQRPPPRAAMRSRRRASSAASS